MRGQRELFVWIRLRSNLDWHRTIIWSRRRKKKRNFSFDWEFDSLRTERRHFFGLRQEEQTNFSLDVQFDSIRIEIERWNRSIRETTQQFFCRAWFRFSSGCDPTMHPIEKRRKRKKEADFSIEFEVDAGRIVIEQWFWLRREGTTFSSELKLNWFRMEIECWPSSRVERKKRTFLSNFYSVQFQMMIEQSFRSRREKKRLHFRQFKIRFTSNRIRTAIAIEKKKERKLFVGIQIQLNSKCDRTLISIERREKKRFFSSIWRSIFSSKRNRAAISIEKGEKRELFSRIAAEFSSNRDRTMVSLENRERKRKFFIDLSFDSLRIEIKRWFRLQSTRKKEVFVRITVWFSSDVDRTIVAIEKREQ